jgi:hypothetical protein
VKGIFELQSPKDLLRKLRFDFEQLQKRPANTYSAFNFFVTAELMKDWLYPGRDSVSQAKREAIENSSRVLQVCSHLANGAKHFRAEARHHRSVKDTHRTGGYWNARYWAANYWAAGYWSKGGLFVDLQGDAAKELGARVSVIVLAESVLAFWENRTELQGP